ncbi:hypothetical protein BN871_AH_00590 [Paenibacillus sp. P22]|nr:hypothetical protein BN871_AH_00590 [Paenibacillus sp. P22]
MPVEAAMLSGLPAAQDAAWQHETGRADRKADLAAVDAAAEALACGHMEQVVEHLRRQARRIGVDQQEERVVGQYFHAGFQEGEQAGLQLPHFSARTSSVGRRIHDDGIVFAAAALLALHEFEHIIRNVADGPVGQAGQLSIFLGPLDHALGRVDMADVGSGRSGCNGGSAGIREQIEHADRAPCAADLVHHPAPVDRLLRKQSRMLEVGRLDVELQFTVGYGPFVRKLLAEIPLPAAGRAAVVMAVCARPAAAVAPVRPYDLRIRPAQGDIPPALQLVSVASIDKFVVFPLVCNVHSGLLGPFASTIVHLLYRVAVGEAMKAARRGDIRRNLKRTGRFPENEGKKRIPAAWPIREA